jgi:hypothetical protein
MATTNFVQFNPNKTLAATDAEYLDSSYRANGVGVGIADVRIHNKMYYQFTTMAAAIAKMLVGRGYDVSDANLDDLAEILANLGGVSWQGEWDVTKIYTINQGVTFDSANYVCNETTVAGESPSMNPEKWTLYVGSTEASASAAEAEAYKIAAETAQAGAVTAKNNAVTAQNGAIAAQTTTEGLRNETEVLKNNTETNATEAAGNATAALSYKTAAETAANNAAISEAAAALNANVVFFDTKAAMDANLLYVEGVRARVRKDSTAANNTYYKKLGASGSGSWEADAVSYIPPNTVSLTELTFPSVVGVNSVNLFNKNTVVVGKYVNYLTGALVTAAGYNASDYIPVSPSTVYVISAQGYSKEQFAFYTSSKVYISGVVGGNGAAITYTTPSTAAYVIHSVKDADLDTFQLELGGNATNYQTYGLNYVNVAAIPTNGIDSKQLAFSALDGIPSKNLFDKTTVTSGYYINYTTGLIAANASYSASDYIPVNPSTQYYATYPGQFAFYTANKVFISGINGTPNPFTTPSSAAYVRLSMLTTNVSTMQLELGSTATSYSSFGAKLDTSTVEDGFPSSKLDITVVGGVPSKNLFNLITITSGFYVNYLTGALVTAAGYNASDYIPVSPSTVYVVNSDIAGIEQFAFYTSDKVFISGLINVNGVSSLKYTTPPTAAYVRHTVRNAQIASYQVNLGHKVNYQTYGTKVPDGTTTIINYITVKTDDTGNFSTIKSAVDSIADATVFNRYQVIVYPGTYTDVNWDMKDYVDIIGINKSTCILQGYLPPDSSDADITAKSTFNWNTTGKVANLTITCQNMRYPIHSDSNGSRQNIIQVIENCIIEHLGNDEARANRVANSLDPNTVWSSENAWGGGTASGMQINAKYTEFKAPVMPFSSHNNANFEKPSCIELDTCRLLQSKEIGSTRCSLRLQSLGSGQQDKIVLKNCELNGKIIHNDTTWMGTANPTTHSEWEVTMVGTTPALYDTSTAIPADSYLRPYVLDQEVELFASEDIERGMAVTYNSSWLNVRKMTNTDAAEDFIGIAITDIAIGARGRIKTKGFEKDTFIAQDSYSAASFGSKYGIGATAGKFTLGATPTLLKGMGTNIIKFNL